jgi:hypothetical protein
MRTLFCCFLLATTLILAPAAMAWDGPVLEAPVNAWQEVLAVFMGWLDGPRELGPTTDPDGIVAATDLDVGATGYEQEDDPDGDMGPYIDPEG